MREGRVDDLEKGSEGLRGEAKHRMSRFFFFHTTRGTLKRENSQEAWKVKNTVQGGEKNAKSVLQTTCRSQGVATLRNQLQSPELVVLRPDKRSFVFETADFSIAACISSYCSESKANEEAGSFCSVSFALSLSSESLGQLFSGCKRTGEMQKTGCLLQMKTNKNKQQNTPPRKPKRRRHLGN